VNPKIITSPLRYPGSKHSLIHYIIEVLNVNRLKPSLYVEPFVGGGSIVINLLSNNLVDQAILIDLDPWITSFWKTVFFDTDWLINQIEQMHVSIDSWYLYKKSNPKTIREQALTCLYLNRTSFSGILEKRAGPIGGKTQNSDYPIDCRFTNKTRITIVKRIREISIHKNKVYGIWNCSWEEAFVKLREKQGKGEITKTNLFFYLDPPFFEEAEALYRYFFIDKDHEELRDYLLQLQDKWLLSYDSAEQVRALYGEALEKRTNGAKHHNIELIYTLAKVSQRKRGKEVIISNLEKLPPQ
jgi:DNA adenine methylase